jgi:hypothetical protein
MELFVTAGSANIRMEEVVLAGQGAEFTTLRKYTDPEIANGFKSIVLDPGTLNQFTLLELVCHK